MLSISYGCWMLSSRSPFSLHTRLASIDDNRRKSLILLIVKFLISLSNTDNFSTSSNNLYIIRTQSQRATLCLIFEKKTTIKYSLEPRKQPNKNCRIHSCRKLTCETHARICRNNATSKQVNKIYIKRKIFANDVSKTNYVFGEMCKHKQHGVNFIDSQNNNKLPWIAGRQNIL